MDRIDVLIVGAGHAGAQSVSLYLNDGRLVAVDAVNSVKDYVQARKLIEARAAIDPILPADASMSLKSHQNWND